MALFAPFAADGKATHVPSVGMCSELITQWSGANGLYIVVLYTHAKL